jgi:hypothetical protein
MPRQWSSEPDELNQPRFVQFSGSVDAWLQEVAATERRSLAWVIREIVTDAHQRATAAQPKRTVAR